MEAAIKGRATEFVFKEGEHSTKKVTKEESEEALANSGCKIIDDNAEEYTQGFECSMFTTSTSTDSHFESEDCCCVWVSSVTITWKSTIYLLDTLKGEELRKVTWHEMQHRAHGRAAFEDKELRKKLNNGALTFTRCFKNATAATCIDAREDDRFYEVFDKHSMKAIDDTFGKSYGDAGRAFHENEEKEWEKYEKARKEKEAKNKEADEKKEREEKSEEKK